jgi:23S rRNA (cytosine1962-C5)-methyltransferase
MSASEVAPAANAPLILDVAPDSNFALIDSGNGQKLERYGRFRIVRPEGQAIWRPSLPQTDWSDVDAVFTGEIEEEGAGRWRFPKGPLQDTWPMAWQGLAYHGRFTAFRHVGVFPEQAAHWRFIDERLRGAGRPTKLLNLFGYTGIASLVAARAGAHVTHIDASKKAIAWARENQDLAGLRNCPIRWICEDAVKYCEREIRRGNRYDAILLDPPKFGRGPKGETWQLFDDLPRLLDLVRQLMATEAVFVILTAYSIRASFFAMHELMRDCFSGRGGVLESGELLIRAETGDRRLSTSLFSRWVNK